MKVSLAMIIGMFPKRRANCARSGYIPMSLFAEVEAELRPQIRAQGMCVQYRGPRISNRVQPGNRPTVTRRCDATHVVLYTARA
jgi:hypothetical protein